MSCPYCGGTGQVLIGGAPAGPGVIPVYGPCGCHYGRAAADLAAKVEHARVEAQKVWQLERLNAERVALEQFQANRERIRDLAHRLITDRPRGSRPVYRNVSFRPWWPFAEPRLAVAEIERAWPIGRINPSLSTHDGWTDLLAVEMGVIRSGRFVALGPDHLHSAAVVDIQPRLEIEPVSGDSDEGLELTPVRVAEVRRRLEADLEAGPDADVPQRNPPPAKPLTVRQRDKQTMRYLRQRPPKY